MKSLLSNTLWVAVLGILVMPLPAMAFGGFVFSDMVPGSDVPAACDGSSFLTPSDGANLFCFHSTGTFTNNNNPDETDVLWNILGGTDIGPGANSAPYAEDAGFGSWTCFENNFANAPGPDHVLWGIITASAGTPGEHEGWVVIDSSPGDDTSSTRPMAPQRLRLLAASAGALTTPGTSNSGFDISFEYVTELSGGTTDVGACYLGGDANNKFGTDFGVRLFAGFNLYRLPTNNSGGPDPAITTPEHYLCGPDADCSTAADNGWVGFIPLDPGVAGVSVDNPTSTTTDAVTWPVGVEDRPGGTGNVDVIFSDRTATNPDLNAEYAYVVQPVLRLNNTGNLGSWNGMAILDLNGDGMPEFIDPSGQGLGLTANGTSVPGNPMILISREVIVSGAAAQTPAGGLEMSGTIDRRNGGINLSFLSSIEGDVVGFNVFRSTDGRSFVRINDAMIAAKGTPLSSYVYNDNLDLRRLRTSQLQYKVEVVLADGTSSLHGPFTVQVGTVQAPGRSRVR